MVGVEFHHDERSGADGRLPKRIVGERLDRDAAQQVRRRDRLGGQLEEAAQRRR
jgi:hypothetical protein